ncbi:MAG TPA: acetylxylan esterase, partial [Pirellulaceae bacterium]|nr:acetylxylan esterase [Pirellulaceae bacterium]
MPVNRQGKGVGKTLFALFCLATLTLAALGCTSLVGAAPIPQDQRPILPGQRHLDSYFPFESPTDQAVWARQRERIRHDVTVSLGLHPLPTRHPLNVVRHSPIDCGDYVIEHVYFESWPGFFVTGNLYIPQGARDQPAPGVLCPHGHWRDGRFLWSSEDEVRKELEQGAETFESNARSVLQSRCVHLAKMGCVVFHYDMLGYADSQQISLALAHGFAQRRLEREGENWGLYSPRAEMELISVMGLQSWNSIRALDFLESLPEVDSQRIGVTGASGGGTQAFVLCAIDDRPMVAFPAVMVSTAMQGGCTCENCSGLRIEIGNVDMAAVFAPKPLGLTAANDWTREMESKGFPQLKALYELLGAPDRVHLTSRLEFGHNYNQVSREAMYDWFHQHLALPGESIRETAIEVRRPDQLTVFGETHPPPPGGDEFEVRLVREMAEDAQRRLGVHRDSTPDDFAVAADEVVRGWRSIIRRPEFHPTFVSRQQITCDNWILDVGYLDYHDQCRPTAAARGQRRGEVEGCGTALIVSRWGADILDDEARLNADFEQMVAPLDSFFVIDLAFQGSLADLSNPLGENALVANGRHAAGYTFGYNRPVFAWRVIQIENAMRWMWDEQKAGKESGGDDSELVLLAP